MQLFGFDGITLAAAATVYYGANLLALWATIWIIRGGKIRLWQLLLCGVVGLPLVLVYGLVKMLRKSAFVLNTNVGRE